jgi:hypothetical protein
MGGFVVLGRNLRDGGQCVAELTGAQGYSHGQCPSLLVVVVHGVWLTWHGCICP